MHARQNLSDGAYEIKIRKFVPSPQIKQFQGRLGIKFNGVKLGNLCGDGETGRHVSLRSLWAFALGGSNPPLRIKLRYVYSCPIIYLYDIILLP